MKILFYYPSNKRTIPIDIALFKLQERGHKIFLLTTTSYGSLHELYAARNIKCIVRDTSSNNKLLRFVKNIIYLIHVCWKFKIDIVHSHLQQTNLVAVCAQFFFKSRVVVFRHHCKFNFLVDDPNLYIHQNEKVADSIINKLAGKIVVPSTSIKAAMVSRESVPPDKVIVIPYMYDVKKMSILNEGEVSKIRDKYKGTIRIIMVSRLTPFKRHEIALKSIISLINKGLDLQVMIMDDGPLLDQISDMIKRNKMKEKIHLLGFQMNVLDYIKAADIIVHPSLTEASNSAVKEAGLCEKIVLVCDKVGDFNDYIVNRVNGFLLDPKKFSIEMEEIITDVYKRPSEYIELGPKLRHAVTGRFGIKEEVVTMYESL